MAVLAESQIRCPFLKDALENADKDAFYDEKNIHYGDGYYVQPKLCGSAPCTEPECTKCVVVTYSGAPGERIKNPYKYSAPIPEDEPDFVTGYCVYKSKQLIDVTGGDCLYDEM